MRCRFCLGHLPNTAEGYLATGCEMTSIRLVSAILVLATVLSLVAGLLPNEAKAQSWPSSWIWIDDDGNENGPADDYRDGRAAFYNLDSQDLYLRVQLWAAADFPDGTRYK